MKAKKENTSRAFGFIFFGFCFLFSFFFKLINCAYFIHNRFSIHSTFKQKYTVTVKDAVLSIKCFALLLFYKICQDKLNVLGIKHVHLGAKYDC